MFKKTKMFNKNVMNCAKSRHTHSSFGIYIKIKFYLIIDGLKKYQQESTLQKKKMFTQKYRKT